MMLPRGTRLVVPVLAVTSLLAAGCADEGVVTDEPSTQAPLETPETQRLPATTGEEATGEEATTEEATGEEAALKEATATEGSVVDIMVAGVTGYPGGDLAGVVMQEVDGLVVGGFATTIDGDPFTTTARVVRPAEPDQLAVSWPHLADEHAVLPPGEYVVALWVDTGLGGYTRWFPINTDAHGLAGCIHEFSVADEAPTEVVVGGDVRSTGYVGVCEPTMPAGEDDIDSDVVETILPGRTRATPPFAGEFDGEAFGMVQELLVWHDQFLAIGRVDSPQPLPDELPAEIAEQFPPEIRDLFPDGLPPTLQEAMAEIQEAGMMSEVSAAVSSIPGAEEAIFGIEPPPPTWLFARSADGTRWERFDATLPDEVAEIHDIAAADDHLVVVGYRPRSGVEPAPSAIVVAWTDDLVSWTMTSVGPDRPADLPEGANLEVWHTSVVANDLGWMVTAGSTVNLGDAEPPLDPSPELAPYLEPVGWGPPPVTTMWYSSWDGEPTITDPTTDEPIETTVDPRGEGLAVATASGFVHLSDVVRFTDDGVVWRTSASLPADASPHAWWSATSQSLSDGFVVIDSGSPSGIVVHRVDDEGERWTPVGVPELPSDLWPVASANGYVFEGDGYDELDRWIVASLDGERWYVERFDVSSVDGDLYEPWVAARHADTLVAGGAFSADDWWVLTF